MRIIAIQQKFEIMASLETQQTGVPYAEGTDVVVAVNATTIFCFGVDDKSIVASFNGNITVSQLLILTTTIKKYMLRVDTTENNAAFSRFRCCFSMIKFTPT